MFVKLTPSVGAPQWFNVDRIETVGRNKKGTVVVTLAGGREIAVLEPPERVLELLDGHRSSVQA